MADPKMSELIDDDPDDDLEELMEVDDDDDEEAAVGDEEEAGDSNTDDDLKKEEDEEDDQWLLESFKKEKDDTKPDVRDLDVKSEVKTEEGGGDDDLAFSSEDDTDEDEEDDEAEADCNKWMKGACRFLCSVCDKTVTGSAGFASHLRSSHPGEEDASGATLVVEERVSCAMCAEEVLHDAPALRAHMARRHAGYDLREYYMKFVRRRAARAERRVDLAEFRDAAGDLSSLTGPVTSRAENLCEYTCDDADCGARCTFWDSMRFHLYRAHGREVDDFNKNLVSKVVLHQCRVCSQRVVCDTKFIVEHVETCCPGSKEYEEDVRIYRMRKAALGDGPTSAEGLLLAAPVTDRVADLCEYKCKTCCDISRSWPDFQAHFSEAHPAERAKVTKLEARCDIKAFLHKCKLCRRLLPCAIAGLAAHLKETHGVGLEDYKRGVGAKLVVKKVRGGGKNKEE